nr:MAG TPA: hypothetical protein [Caudoviricetes sp.]
MCLYEKKNCFNSFVCLFIILVAMSYISKAIEEK